MQGGGSVAGEPAEALDKGEESSSSDDDYGSEANSVDDSEALEQEAEAYAEMVYN